MIPYPFDERVHRHLIALIPRDELPIDPEEREVLEDILASGPPALLHAPGDVCSLVRNLLVTRRFAFEDGVVEDIYGIESFVQANPLARATLLELGPRLFVDVRGALLEGIPGSVYQRRDGGLHLFAPHVEALLASAVAVSAVSPAADRDVAPRTSGLRPTPRSLRAARKTVPPSGAIVGRKYEVGEVVGEGAVSIVVRAHDTELDRPVALKFLRTELAEEPSAVARFRREARIASRLDGEHVCRVFDLDRSPEGVPFLVMELLEGEDLESALRRGGPASTRRAAEWIVMACEALATAHARGLVHRDVKPSNLFLAWTSGVPKIKLLDFGVAETYPEPTLDPTGGLSGSPLYMAPEQIACGPIDPRVDVWALGVTLYELVTGEPPFFAETVEGVYAAIMDGPRSLHEQSTSGVMPRAILDVVDVCLRRDPRDRFANVAELAMALLPVAPRRARILADHAQRALFAGGKLEASQLREMSSFPPPSGSTIVEAESSSTRLPPPPLLPSDARKTLAGGLAPSERKKG